MTAPEDRRQGEECDIHAGPSLCTWDRTCPRRGAHRLERRDRPDLSVVENVCDAHRCDAEAAGYVLRSAGALGPLRRPVPPGDGDR